MNSSQDSHFRPEDTDHVIDRFGKPLRTEHRKALRDRLHDERKRYESMQKEKSTIRQRGKEDRGR
ncbi:hypothetical protein JIN85_13990 [Luteolibacter pohnpeiensis]|uniref:Uncharacterized protein n=1 Tax=Luteolibacter pohnpeiensis TaxID=454153 RepID=A0A934S7A7_9BACT|nr:hypothetical protein [Luteolibacter pohnpeiensis]MBK1883532.1 hypothetical protein [Luteolibacter pohnpeiensis]